MSPPNPTRPRGTGIPCGGGATSPGTTMTTLRPRNRQGGPRALGLVRYLCHTDREGFHLAKVCSLWMWLVFYVAACVAK